MTFAEWLEQQDDEITSIQVELLCSRVRALEILLLMRLTGDLYEAEPWEGV